MANQSQFEVELEQEEDGRWIGEIPSLPGVLVYGATRSQAQAAVQALALRVLADRGLTYLTPWIHVERGTRKNKGSPWRNRNS